MFKEVNKDIRSLATLESAEHQKSTSIDVKEDDFQTEVKNPSVDDGMHNLDDTIMTAKRKSVLQKTHKDHSSN